MGVERTTTVEDEQEATVPDADVMDEPSLDCDVDEEEIEKLLELEEELAAIHRRASEYETTDDEGILSGLLPDNRSTTATVTSIEKEETSIGTKAVIEARIKGTDEVQTFETNWPSSPKQYSRGNPLIRLLKLKRIHPSNLADLLGEEIPVFPDTAGGYRLVVPTRGKGQRFIHGITSAAAKLGLVQIDSGRTPVLTKVGYAVAPPLGVLIGGGLFAAGTVLPVVGAPLLAVGTILMMLFGMAVAVEAFISVVLIVASILTSLDDWFNPFRKFGGESPRKRRRRSHTARRHRNRTRGSNRSQDPELPPLGGHNPVPRSRDRYRRGRTRGVRDVLRGR